jgi:hypothetical protein
VRDYTTHRSIGFNFQYEEMFEWTRLGIPDNSWIYIDPINNYNFCRIDDPKCNAFLKEYYSYGLIDEPKQFQLAKEITPYVLEQAYWLHLPDPYAFTFWSPWLGGYHGEFTTGWSQHHLDFPQYIWVDMDLKKHMLGAK